MKVEAIQGKQVPLKWTETSGGLWELWHDPGIPLPFPVEPPPPKMRRESPEFFPNKAAKGALNSSYEEDSGLLWLWAGPSCFLSSGDVYVGELLELQQECEGPFGSSKG